MTNKGLSELNWLVRDYCCILWDKVCGKENSDSLSSKQQEIADYLNVSVEEVLPYLKKIEYNRSDGYLFLKTSAELSRLKK